MALYRVVYVIDVEAESPEKAAEEVHKIMADPEATPPLLDVYEEKDEQFDFTNGVRVDLSVPQEERQLTAAPDLGTPYRLLADLVKNTEEVYSEEVWTRNPYGGGDNADLEEGWDSEGFDWPNVIDLAQQARRFLRTVEAQCYLGTKSAPRIAPRT